MNDTDVVDTVRCQPCPPSGTTLLGALTADGPRLSGLWGLPQPQDAASLKVMSDLDSSPHPVTDQ